MENHKILVVDDDVRLRELLQRYLAQQGFSVDTLPDARDLDRKLARNRPDLLVLDVMMPGDDGLAVVRRLREQGEQIRVMMLTARGEDIDRILGLEMGADDYLAKPFNPRELLARIKAVLRRQSHAAEIGPGGAVNGKAQRIDDRPATRWNAMHARLAVAVACHGEQEQEVTDR